MLHSLKIIANLINKFINKPLNFIGSVAAFIRGTFYILYFRLFRQNVRIGFPFIAFAPLKIVGPGSVFIGKKCGVYKNVFKGLTIVTHSSDSSVQIGDRCLLGGVTIRCKKQVQIGDKTMTAVSLIQDSFFIEQGKINSLIAKGILLEPKPIMIGENVWLGADSIVLGGSKIGKDSVLSAGAWCFDSEIGEYSLVSGNPAKRPLQIEKLLRFKGVA